MDLNRIGRLVLTGGLMAAFVAPALARPTTTIALPDNIQTAFPFPDSAGGFPFPVPGMGGGVTIPIPLPGGGSLPIPIQLPGQGGGYQGYNIPGSVMLPIPLPGGGTMPIPISLPGSGNGYYPPAGYQPGYYPPQTGGYFPQPQTGYFPQPRGGGYFPQPQGGPLPRPGDWAGHGHQHQPPTDGRVAGYDTITYQGQPCAVNRQNLPLLVYSSSPGQAHLLQYAAQTWNEAGQRMGGIKFIEVINGPAHGAIEVDWSGRGMPAGAAGLTTMMKSRDGVRVTGIGIKPMRSASQTKLIEVLSHEIGHALGLDHSDDRGDLMYRSTRPQSERRQMLSERDFQMLQWLYSLQNAVPIVAAR